MIYGSKFSAVRWTGPWRVLEVLQNIVLVLTLAEDPLIIKHATIGRAKPATLTPEMLTLYERWWNDAQEQRQALREDIRERKIAMRDERWVYDAGRDIPQVVLDNYDESEAEELLRYHAENDSVDVRWKGGAITTEPASMIKKELYGLWMDFVKKNKTPLQKGGVM